MIRIFPSIKCIQIIPLQQTEHNIGDCNCFVWAIPTFKCSWVFNTWNGCQQHSALRPISLLLYLKHQFLPSLLLTRDGDAINIGQTKLSVGMKSGRAHEGLPVCSDVLVPAPEPNVYSCKHGA